MLNSFYFLTKTKPGKYAVTFIIVAIVLVSTIIVVSMNMDILAKDTGFFGNMSLALITLGAFSCAIISTITGLVAVFKNKERSALVYSCIMIDSLAICFGIAQIVGEIV